MMLKYLLPMSLLLLSTEIYAGNGLLVGPSGAVSQIDFGWNYPVISIEDMPLTSFDENYRKDKNQLFRLYNNANLNTYTALKTIETYVTSPNIGLITSHNNEYTNFMIPMVGITIDHKEERFGNTTTLKVIEFGNDPEKEHAPDYYFIPVDVNDLKENAPTVYEIFKAYGQTEAKPEAHREVAPVYGEHPSTYDWVDDWLNTSKQEVSMAPQNESLSDILPEENWINPELEAYLKQKSEK